MAVPVAQVRTRRRAAARRQLTGIAFVAPFVIVFAAFMLIPLINAAWMSVHTNTLAQGEQFIWFENYARALNDPIFLDGVWLVIRFSLVLIPVQMAVSLLAALILDALTSRFSRAGRLIIFLPYAVPAVIGALMWGFLFSQDFGPIADIARFFGVPAPDLLGPEAIFGALVNIVTWQWAGYYMIILYAALKGIDPSLYEAARLDGANAWQMAVRIKIPIISPALILVLVFALIGTLQFFTEPQVLRSIAGGSIGPGYTPNLYAYTVAFYYGQFNYASAIAFVLAMVIAIGSFLFMWLTRSRSGDNS